MQNETEALITRLRTYCLTKPGANETFTFGEERPTYCVLEGFLDHFASFYLTEEPICFQLRCEDGLLQEMQKRYGAQIAVSTRMKWETVGWKWVDVQLPGSIQEADLHRLIDGSYDLVFRALDEDARRLISLTESPIDLQRALDTLIDSHHLSHRREQIQELIRPAILLRTQKCDMAKFLSAQSRIGGVPDLPADWKWPAFDGKPLAFLAQINLAEIPSDVEREDLPVSGILYFFSVFGWQQDDGDLHPDLDWSRADEPDFSQVLLFSGDASSLQRSSKPDGIRTFSVAEIAFLSGISLPRAADYAREPVVTALQWPEEEYDRLDDLYFEFDYIARKARGFSVEHQLLGYASAIQAAVTRPDDQLLFQVDSDYYQTGMMWGDGGMIYFVIPQVALKQRDFSKIMSDYQCG